MLQIHVKKSPSFYAKPGFFFLLAVLCLFPLSLFAKGKLDDPKVIPWGDELGAQRLSQSVYKRDFFRLANHFESQNNKIYCGVASSVIVLNALRVRNGDKQSKKPKADAVLSESDREYIPFVFSPFFDRYTQDNVFTAEAKSKLEILGKPIEQKAGGKKRDIGLQLEQLRGLLASHELDVKKIVAGGENGLEVFRTHLMANMLNTENYLLVNYTRKTLDQKGGGHISPIGAYHKASDSVLIMDVNSNKADWVWVKLALLYESMSTFDTNENRGYLLISEK